MKYLFELSKEHRSIPKSEVTACLCAEKIDYELIEDNNDVLVIDTNAFDNKIKTIGDRLSYTFYVDEFLFSCSTSIDEIQKDALDAKIDKKGSIAIKCKNRSNTVKSKPITQALAEIYTKGRTVSLEKPDIEIRSILTDSNVYVGIKKAEINRSKFEERKAQNRPFFSPISLHPKLARALVNLSGVCKDQVLLDPFCGTGGILIEAGLMNIRVIGSDIEEKMIEGCRQNLNHYKTKNFELYHSDIGEIQYKIGCCDVVVTDFPYGRSTTTKGEKIEDLCTRSFKNISELLKPGGKAVVGLSKPELIEKGKEHLNFVEKYEIKAHRSLTRYFVVYKKT